MLEAFKDSPLPLEIRQIRVNFEDKEAVFATGDSSGGGGIGREVRGSGSGGPTEMLPGELIVEFRGVAYLIQPYDEKKVAADGLADSTDEGSVEGAEPTTDQPDTTNEPKGGTEAAAEPATAPADTAPAEPVPAEPPGEAQPPGDSASATVPPAEPMDMPPEPAEPGVAVPAK
jgi:hypothetical protein